MRDVLEWQDDSLTSFAYDEQLALSCGWSWWHDDVCALSDRMQEVHFDKDERLHKDGGAAILYPDGWSIYALHGVNVPDWLALRKPHEFSPTEDFRKKDLDNIEVRREYVRKVGVERCLTQLGWALLDKDGNYELGGVVMGDSRRVYLKMLNPSVEGIWHIEAVHPSCENVQQAKNWRAYGSKDRHWQPYQLT
jgi:hypothetical protein